MSGLKKLLLEEAFTNYVDIFGRRGFMRWQLKRKFSYFPQIFEGKHFYINIVKKSPNSYSPHKNLQNLKIGSDRGHSITT